MLDSPHIFAGFFNASTVVFRQAFGLLRSLVWLGPRIVSVLVRSRPTSSQNVWVDVMATVTSTSLSSGMQLGHIPEHCEWWL